MREIQRDTEKENKKEGLRNTRDTKTYKETNQERERVIKDPKNTRVITEKVQEREKEKRAHKGKAKGNWGNIRPYNLITKMIETNGFYWYGFVEV